MGTCDDEQAARVRVRWAERMWSEVQKEVVRPKQALDIGVALAVKRLWSVEGRGDYLRSWAVGPAEAVAHHAPPATATSNTAAPKRTLVWSLTEPQWGLDLTSLSRLFGATAAIITRHE